MPAKSRLALCYPMDCSPPGSSVHRILQARILEWVTMPSSRGRPGADSPSLPALGAPFPADPRDALNARRPLLPAPVLGGVQPLPGQGSPLVSPSHRPLLRWHHLLPQGVHLWDRSPPCVIYSCFRSRQRVSGPRVREQEETSGFPRSSRGRPPISPLGLQPPGWSRAPGVLGPRG